MFNNRRARRHQVARMTRRERRAWKHEQEENVKLARIRTDEEKKQKFADFCCTQAARAAVSLHKDPRIECAYNVGQYLHFTTNWITAEVCGITLVIARFQVMVSPTEETLFVKVLETTASSLTEVLYYFEYQSSGPPWFCFGDSGRIEFINELRVIGQYEDAAHVILATLGHINPDEYTVALARYARALEEESI